MMTILNLDLYTINVYFSKLCYRARKEKGTMKSGTVSKSW